MGFLDDLSAAAGQYRESKRQARLWKSWVILFIGVIVTGFLAVNKLGINPRRPPGRWGEFTSGGWSNELVVPKGVVITDADMAELKDPKLAHLKSFFLQGQERISSDGYRHLVHLRYLERIGLINCNVFDSALEDIGTLPELKYLDLSGNPIHGDGFVHLHTPKLRELHLRETRVSGDGALMLDLKNLADLHLQGSPISGEVPGDAPDSMNVRLLRRRLPYTLIAIRSGSNDVEGKEARAAKERRRAANIP